eukprot:EG_transcript_11427
MLCTFEGRTGFDLDRAIPAQEARQGSAAAGVPPRPRSPLEGHLRRHERLLSKTGTELSTAAAAAAGLEHSRVELDHLDAAQMVGMVERFCMDHATGEIPVRDAGVESQPAISSRGIEAEAALRASLGQGSHTRRTSRATHSAARRFDYVWNLWNELNSDLESDHHVHHSAGVSLKAPGGASRTPSVTQPRVTDQNIPPPPILVPASPNAALARGAPAADLPLAPPPSLSAPAEAVDHRMALAAASAEAYQLNIELLADELLAEVADEPNDDEGPWETSDAAPEGPPAQDPAALPRDGIGEGLAFGPFEIPQALPVFSLEEFLAHLSGKYATVQHWLAVRGEPRRRESLMERGSGGAPMAKDTQWESDDSLWEAEVSPSRRPVSAPMAMPWYTRGQPWHAKDSDASASATKAPSIPQRPPSRPMTADACLEVPWQASPW